MAATSNSVMTFGIKKPRRDPITAALQRRILAFGEGPISCALTVDGHPYWWILEYGSGKYHVKAHSRRGVNDLKQPLEAMDRLPGEGPNQARFSPYQIVAGQLREPPNMAGKKLLRFYSRKLGRWVSAKRVTYPGVHAVNRGQGFIRLCLYRFQSNLSKALGRLNKGGYTPEYNDIVDVVNDELDKFLIDLMNHTPYGDSLTHTPLAHAWGVVHAKYSRE